MIAEEFAEWEGPKRRVDLLGVDREANLVVVELKRDDEGGHGELQAIRYAAMVSKMKFDEALVFFGNFLDRLGDKRDAKNTLLEFPQWNEPQEDKFAQDVRIVLVSAEFSRELTTAVLWLNDYGMDTRCVRLKPYDSGDGALIDAQEIIPLPEASQYQERVRQKAIEEREARKDTGYWFMNTGDGESGDRAWEDSKDYGFMRAGGGARYIVDVKNSGWATRSLLISLDMEMWGLARSLPRRYPSRTSSQMARVNRYLNLRWLPRSPAIA